VSIALAISLAKVIGAVALLASVLAMVSSFGKRLKLQPEVSRKLIHVSLGLGSLAFPWLFQAFWEVAATCGLSLLLFAVVRSRRGREGIGSGLHGVKRDSYGDLLFALSVMLLFHLKDGHYWLKVTGVARHPQIVLYILPLLILTLCDAACALVGVNYGRQHFRVEAGIKSWEGVAVFIATAWLFSLIALLLFSDVSRADAVVLSLIAALFGALFEAASWRGLDNLFIPLGLYLVLSNLMPRGLPILLIASAGFVAITGLLLAIGNRFRADRHTVATATTLFFCFIIFAGPESLITPLMAVLVYVVGRWFGRSVKPEVPFDSLSLLLTILVLGLTYYVLSDLMRANTICAFTLSFAAMAAAMAVRFGRGRPWFVIAAVALGWIGIALEITYEGLSAAASPFLAASAVMLFTASGVAWGLERYSPERPWLKLGGLSLAAGLLLMPLSPA